MFNKECTGHRISGLAFVLVSLMFFLMHHTLVDSHHTKKEAHRHTHTQGKRGMWVGTGLKYNNLILLWLVLFLLLVILLLLLVVVVQMALVLLLLTIQLLQLLSFSLFMC